MSNAYLATCLDFLRDGRFSAMELYTAIGKETAADGLPHGATDDEYAAACEHATDDINIDEGAFVSRCDPDDNDKYEGHEDAKPQFWIHAWVLISP